MKKMRKYVTLRIATAMKQSLNYEKHNRRTEQSRYELHSPTGLAYL